MIRLVAVIEALAEHADVHLFCFVHADRDLPCNLPDGPEVARCQTATYREAPLTWRRRLRWLVSTTPLRLVTANHDGVRPRFSRWADDAYDLVWFSRAQTYEVLGRPRLGPTVVDFDDLEDQKLLGRLAVTRDVWWRMRPREIVARAQAHLDARRWRRVQRLIAARVDAVTVCSGVDAGRLGAAATVLPNTYEVPVERMGGRQISDRPTLLFVGLLDYPPNADAATWLVGDILPRLRRIAPDCTVRLVGRADPSLAATLGRGEGVHVVGPVPSMNPELALADLVVVPVRFGSGTRVKILEAFAHHLPVVSTTLGAEGLDARDGEHLLLADGAEEFAAACARLVQQVGLRERLTHQAAEHHRLHFTPESARRVAVGLFADLANPVGLADP